jgi:hypothetical protein
MDHGPDSPAKSHIVQWIEYERDAAWTAKLAILRASRCEDIAHFGECLREHERHADELAVLARMADRTAQIPTEPTFVTGDPFVVGAIEGGRALLEAMERLEVVRIERYACRSPAGADQPASMLNGLLDRHLADARARLGRLRRLREWRRDAAA